MDNTVTNAEHRERARRALTGKWGIMVLLLLAGLLLRMVIGGLVGSVGSFPDGSFADQSISFILNNAVYFAFSYGTFYAALQVIREKNVELSMVTVIFKGEYYLPMLLINLLQYIAQLLVNLVMMLPILIVYGATMYMGMMFNTLSIAEFQVKMSENIGLALVMAAVSLLAVLLGIFVEGVFQFAVWVKIDQKELGVGDVLRTALDLMKGRFKQYFFLQLSFIGWYIIGTLAFGIGLLWVIPYHNVAVASFYDSARADRVAY